MNLPRDGKATRLTAELVALCERPSPKLGPEPGLSYLTVGEHAELAEQLLEQSSGELWVFAYGSLLWRPAFEIAETRRAKALGWRRDFCLEIPRWRGSPEQPGLMMALSRGGHCEAFVQRIGGARPRDELVKLLRREIDTSEDIAALKFIETETAMGPVRALACWAEPVESRFFTNKPIETQAQMLARACGSTGSCAAYVYHTQAALVAHGITDHYLSELADRVAGEIMALHGLQDA